MVKTILRSRILAGNSQTIAEDAGIVVENGFVTGVGKFAEVKQGIVGARTLEFDGIICPALINSHTHLELSPFKKIPHKDFVDWVLHLVSVRYSRQYSDVRSECVEAKCQSEKLGTSYFVNVGNDFELNEFLGKNQLFQFEQIGMNVTAAEDIFKKAVSFLSGKNEIQAALAIHGPYSTSAQLMKKIKTFNNSRNLITSVHLAETESEVEFIRFGRGRMTDLLNMRLGTGSWSFRGTGLSPVEYVDSLGILDEKTLCVHCVFVEEKDLEILKKRNCGIVVCVRSNRNLSGSIPDISRFMKSGIRVMLGTDSLASSPDLDMFAEMSSFYGEYHDVLNPSAVFRMATTDPSEFLGIKNLYGEIAPGKSASVVFAPFAEKKENVFEFLVSEAKGKTQVVSC
ncbi:MAG TPA: amidohydrolase family protein [Candidatus Acidoferrales bacterium]|nr:amidohydrolase family protein [Candidatus Acidoferrales bacterium]